jgi:hypothetical protein
LNETLNLKAPQERFIRDPTLSELVSAVRIAQKKIQKWIEEGEQADKTGICSHCLSP